MSSVSFNTPSGSVLIRGPERAHAMVLAQRMLHAALGIDGLFSTMDKVIALFPEGHYVRRPGMPDLERRDTLCRYLGSMVSFGDDKLRVPGHDEPIDSIDLAFNTMVAAGSDPMRLLIRMSGACELWGFIYGEDRAWVAGIIDEGLESGVLRQDASAYGDGVKTPSGWKALAEMLRSRNDEPVVLSYSVTEGFPHYYGLDLSDIEVERPDWLEEGDEWGDEEELQEARSEKFYELPYEEQWARAWKAHNVPENAWLRIQPTDWATYRWGKHGLNGFDLMAILAEQEALTTSGVEG